MPTSKDKNTDKKYPTGLMWFRRDLRCFDNAALYHALKECRQLHCVFIFDREILDPLIDKGLTADRRVEFIHESLAELDTALRALAVDASDPAACGLIVRHATAREAIPALAQALHAQAVFCNHDYEPAAVERDTMVRGALAHQGVSFVTFKDHVVFEKEELLTQQGRAYGVFTPYKNAWLKKVDDFYLKPYPVARYAEALAPRPKDMETALPGLAQMGFVPTNLHELKIPTGASGGEQLFDEFFERMDRYGATRDFPAVKGPSYLGVHLRFGTVSVRQLASVARKLVAKGSEGAAVWLGELIWRDFYAQIIHHFPHAASKAFKAEYDAIHWEHGKQAQTLFAAWCEGRTGYPLVDAAMAQINQTGYMHNRLRMVVASFLVKDLGIDWRWGEHYFADHLNDYDLASNNGGWQWASSSGCDAQPYFRIFNPVSQSERFDPEGKFIRRYLPQLALLSDRAIHAPWLATEIELVAANLTLGKDYPRPIVDHAEARDKTLLRYAVVKKNPALPRRI